MSENGDAIVVGERDENAAAAREKKNFITWLLGAAAIWVVFAWLMVFALRVGSAQPWRVVAIAAGISAAAGAIGAAVAFLFGIPRLLSDSDARALERPNGGVRSNSNLEQISDWLTKIVVGVGLTQLYQIPGALGRLGNAVGPSLGDQPASGTFGVVAALYSFFIAFLLMYMWTRTRFLRVVQLYEQNPATVAPDAVQPG